MQENSIWEDIKQNFIRNDSMLTKIILTNTFVFLICGIAYVMLYLGKASEALEPFVREWLGAPASFGKLLFRPWTAITYMFTQINFLHYLFNMVILYWFGLIFQEFLGNRRLLPVYILGGLSGLLLFMLSYNVLEGVGYFDGVLAYADVIGASASVMAVLFACATLMPDFRVHLLLLGAVRLKYLALGLIVLDIILIQNGDNPGGRIAHLGGALFGFLYVVQLKRGVDWGKWLENLIEKIVGWVNGIGARPGPKVVYKRDSSGSSPTPKSRSSKVDQEKVDEILDKISQSGYDSLSTEEKQILFRASNEK